MENARWYFTKDQLEKSPSITAGLEPSKELSYRQQAAHFIQDMGQRVEVSQLCINTAIVYMHRFYMCHSFIDVHRNILSIAALFLAAKVEEQPRKLEHLVKVAHVCLRKYGVELRMEAFTERQVEVVAHENILLQTLGFDLAIEHPHTYVVKVCQLVKANKDLAQKSYYAASRSLHMTTMCLQYRPTVVACVCIYFACKWSNWKIEPCSEGKEWYYYVDRSVTVELLETLTNEFITIMETSSHQKHLKQKFVAQKDGMYNFKLVSDDYGFMQGKLQPMESKPILKKESLSPSPSTSVSLNSSSNNNNNEVDVKPIVLHSESNEKYPAFVDIPEEKLVTASATVTSNTVTVTTAEASPPPKPKVEATHSISLAVYREKREKERLLEQKTFSEMNNSHLLVKSGHVEKLHYTGEHKSHHTRPSSSKLAEDLLDIRNHSKINNKVTISNTPTSYNKANQLLKMPSESSHRKMAKHSLSDSNHNSANQTKSASDPFVLLTRVDETSSNKEIAPPNQLPNAVNLLPNHFISSDKNNKVKLAVGNVEKRERNEDSKNSIRNVQLKHKHQKHKTNSSLHNNHMQGLPQGHSLPTEEPKISVDSKIPSMENNTVPVKNTEMPVNKHERREKHRHKHSSHHSSKEKAANHHPPATEPIPVPGIKITIPKDKISLSSVPSQKCTDRDNSPKKGIKIKLPKPPAAEAAPLPKVDFKPNSLGASLKLVLTKDKSGSGSYSTSHKSGSRESRKRSHEHSKNSERSKLPKLEDGVFAKPHKSSHRQNSHRSSSGMEHPKPHPNEINPSKVQFNDTGQYNNFLMNNTYTAQAYYPPTYYPYHLPPPPLPPPLPQSMKMATHPPLPPPPAPQPPPPPE